MLYVATESRSIRNPKTGRMTTIIAGHSYGKREIRDFLSNGKSPVFLKPVSSCHVTRFIPKRQELHQKLGIESCTYLAAVLAIFVYFDGDIARIRKASRGGGIIQWAQRMEKFLAPIFDVQPIDAPHHAQDPLVDPDYVWTKVYPLTKNQESMAIDIALNDLKRFF